MRLDLLSS